MKKQTFKHYRTKAKKMDWDSLAYEIIMLDICIGNKKFKIERKIEIGMVTKRDAFEAEKRDRVIKSFNYDRYLNNMGYQDGLPVEEDDGFSNI